MSYDGWQAMIIAFAILKILSMAAGGAIAGFILALVIPGRR